MKFHISSAQDMLRYLQIVGLTPMLDNRQEAEILFNVSNWHNGGDLLNPSWVPQKVN